jgi:hypothetical protein
MKRKANTKTANLNLDSTGKREVRVGCVICDDGPTFGRVLAVIEGGILYRPFDGQDVDPTQPVVATTCRQVTVVEGDGVGVRRLPGNADKWVRIAHEVAAVLAEVEYAKADGSLGEVMGDADARRTVDLLEEAFTILWDGAGGEVLGFDDPKEVDRGA